MKIKNWRIYIYWFFDLCVSSLAFFLGRLFPLRNCVVITNYYGAGFGDNGKAIAIKLHQVCPEVEIYWQVDDLTIEMPDWINKIKTKTFHSYFQMAVSKIWIDNSRKPLNIRKRSCQFYIQTWHGFNGLKKAEGDSIDALSKRYIQSAKHDSAMINLFLSNGKFFTDTIRRAFWYNGEILECGAPRCDILHDKTYKRKVVRNFFDIPDGKSILLYAPTFRNSHKNVYDIDFNRLAESVKKKFSKDVVILLRLHPNMRNMNLGVNFNKNLLDATSYPDMYELMAESDFFITDYSSSLFEFASTMKPTFIYASDVQDYAFERGYHFDIMNLPVPLAQNNDELESNIMAFNSTEFKQKMEIFMTNVGINDSGKASRLVVERILQELRKS